MVGQSVVRRGESDGGRTEVFTSLQNRPTNKVVGQSHKARAPNLRKDAQPAVVAQLKKKAALAPSDEKIWLSSHLD